MTETLLKADKLTLVIEALREGKVKLGAQSWEDGKTILDGQQLVVRNVDRQVHLLRQDTSTAPPPPPPIDAVIDQAVALLGREGINVLAPQGSRKATAVLSLSLADAKTLTSGNEIVVRWDAADGRLHIVRQDAAEARHARDRGC